MTGNTQYEGRYMWQPNKRALLDWASYFALLLLVIEILYKKLKRSWCRSLMMCGLYHIRFGAPWLGSVWECSLHFLSSNWHPSEHPDDL